jgi:hypothetical protein
MHTTVRIEINGHAHEVYHQHLTGAQIKGLGHHEHELLFRLEGHERHQIGDEERVHLHDGECFLTVLHPQHQGFEIEVDGKPYFTGRRRLTGAEIKALAKRPPANTLYRLEGNQRIRVADNESVELHEHERFVTVPPHGHAS